MLTTQVNHTAINVCARTRRAPGIGTCAVETLLAASADQRTYGEQRSAGFSVQRSEPVYAPQRPSMRLRCTSKNLHTFPAHSQSQLIFIRNPSRSSAETSFSIRKTYLR